MIRSIILLLILILLIGNISNGQTDSIISSEKDSKVSSDYTNEFLISGGYNYCQYNFIDAGLRYYHWRNDGQTAMAFAGIAAGCEFSMQQTDQIYIPYIGWQGQMIFLGYGLRAEYAVSKEKQSWGFSPELGLSLIEILRVNFGYRFIIEKNDPLELSGFRFSVIVALPLSILKADTE